MRIFHITEAAQWARSAAKGLHEQSTRGRSLAQVGFIHCSSWDQLPATAEFVYAGVNEPLVVLEIEVDLAESAGTELRYEHGNPDDTSSALFPHLYGPLPTACVCRVLTAGFDDRGAFVVDTADGGPAQSA
ncbi:MAG: DUF952 domain-containing protein [Ornithinimicrobium sp.]